MDKKWKLIEKDGYSLAVNEGGPTLGAGNASIFIEVDGLAFKDLNGNGILDAYEDWRRPFEDRAADLASRLSLEEIAGLMLYSPHQMLSKSLGVFAALATMDGIPDEVKALYGMSNDDRENSWDLSTAQKSFLSGDHVRHVLVATVDDAQTAARWNNNAQAFVEGLEHGIPINTSSDPRHELSAIAEYDMGAGGKISKWPTHAGLAATLDPAVVEGFGKIASKEYRALGIATALSPQVDLASDPRWNRFNGTFGSSSKLSADLARAYCDGFQTSEGDKELADGWGFDSVNAMAKHWPGGGSGEGGRDAHYGFGKCAVYPGGNFSEHLIPFTEGAFKLSGKTGQASAVMPYYTISWDQDSAYGENVGNSYSRYIITDLLREKYGYDGVVCTDWNITHNAGNVENIMSGKCWGVEDLSITDRHYKALVAGVDQFGGNSDAKPVIEAYNKGVAEFGEEYMKERFTLSAKRLLKNIFRVGLFENPYLDPDESAKIVGNDEYVSQGYEAQLKSVALLKNKGALPLKKGSKVYIPKRRNNAGRNWFGIPMPAGEAFPIDPKSADGYYTLVDSPEEADCAFVFISSPSNVGYMNGEYIPVSLQYRPYTALDARAQSVAAPDGNRSYKGKSASTSIEPHLDSVLETRQAMGEKPVVVFINMANPTVVAEFEKAADAILVDFGVTQKALMALASGEAEPSALLPFIIPKDMSSVEKHCEDIPFDIPPHEDECGNRYDFAFGMNWSGVIEDWRTEKYKD
ncbi:MAG: glycoside hydrolase family 3 protein [Clostridiales bacterium]|jgi:beta-glucosidase|nr:glycoside hydrolase family 3 protein [Clostridiales bacterium]